MQRVVLREAHHELELVVVEQVCGRDLADSARDADAEVLVREVRRSARVAQRRKHRPHDGGREVCGGVRGDGAEKLAVAAVGEPAADERRDHEQGAVVQMGRQKTEAQR